MAGQNGDECLHGLRCEHFSGWTRTEIDNLVTQQDVPDHWWRRPEPNLAFLEAVRIAVDRSNTTYRGTFPKVLSTLHLQEPRHLGNFLKKVKTKSRKASQSNNSVDLLAEMSELKADRPKQIGPCCESAGITIPWLDSSANVQPDTIINNEMALEILKYKRASSLTWQNLSVLWPRLFPGSNVPDRRRVRQRLVKLPKKREMMRKKGKDKQRVWLKKPFVTIPVNQEHVHTPESNDEDKEDDEEDWIPPIDSEAWKEHERLQNDTMSYLDALDIDNNTSKNLIKNAMKNRKHALDMYWKKRDEIRKKLRAQEQKHIVKEIKKMDDIRNSTSMAAKYMICEKVSNISDLIDLVRNANVKSPKAVIDEEIVEAIKSQIRFYKSVNFSSKINSRLFRMSDGKKQLALNELKSNLTKILQCYEKDNTPEDGQGSNATSSTCDEEDQEELEKLKSKEELKRKYIFKGTSLSKKKKRNPFPGDCLVGRRISLKFRTASGKQHLFYKGTVLRKSTDADMKEFLEEEDEQFVGIIDFYIVKFDDPHDETLCCYPLEKEWMEDCLNFI